MSAGINQIHRIVIAIAIEVQAVDGFRIQVSSIIGRDESTPLWGVISGVAVIQAGIVIVVITAITNGVGICNGIIGSTCADRTVAPGVIQALDLQNAVGVINCHHVALEVALEIVNWGGDNYILPVFLLSVNKKVKLARKCRPARFLIYSFGKRIPLSLGFSDFKMKCVQNIVFQCGCFVNAQSILFLIGARNMFQNAPAIFTAIMKNIMWRDTILDVQWEHSFLNIFYILIVDNVLTSQHTARFYPVFIYIKPF